jgi:hypothetical protein
LIVEFLGRVGLDVREASLDGVKTFMPGIHVADGRLLFDRERLLYPGDLLHEAGHLAIVTPGRRAGANGRFVLSGGNEIAAIAWSYAAAVALQLDLAILFHDDGYRGGASALRDNFSAGRYIGVPVLVWLGMTSPPGQSGDPRNEYPAMRSWLNETSRDIDSAER